MTPGFWQAWDRVQRPLWWVLVAFTAYALVGSMVFGDNGDREPASSPGTTEEVSYR